MKLSLFGDVRRVRLFWGVEVANVDGLLLDHQLRLPSQVLLIPGNAKQSAAKVVCLCSSFVLRIYRSIGLAQVDNPVVQLVAVDVVNFHRRPLPMRQEPRKPMCCIDLAVDLYAPVAIKT